MSKRKREKKTLSFGCGIDQAIWDHSNYKFFLYLRKQGRSNDTHIWWWMVLMMSWYACVTWLMMMSYMRMYDVHCVVYTICNICTKCWLFMGL